jgi:acetoin utilization deacetylase AcuC-like enzyme
MLTIYSSDHCRHQGVELKDGVISESFEQPVRAEAVLRQVKAAALGEIVSPSAYERRHYVGAHSERYVEFLAGAWDEWTATGRTGQALPLVWPVRGFPSQAMPEFIDGKLGLFSMDAGSPITAGTWDAVSASANSALTGVEALSDGTRAAFALCRPPGHHAGHESMGGYCYLNNAAIAAQRCIEQGAQRVAILDIDFHHGNGTQEIFYDRQDVLYVSIHGDPSVSFPYFSGYADERGAGDGLGSNINLPLPRGTTFESYEGALLQAGGGIARHSADALIVSLGVDTFESDSIGHFRLSTPDFTRIGQIIATFNLPTLFVMEGGYMVDEIGVNAVNVLLGFEGRA